MKVEKFYKKEINNREAEEVIIKEVMDAIDQLLTPDVKGIGIGVPSMVDVDKGIVYNVEHIPSWREVHLGDDLLGWITRLVRASRPGPDAPQAVRDWVRWGAGPRAGQSLVLAAKARALLHGRYAATREDVQALAAPVMRHRLLLSFAAEAEQKDADDVVAALLRAVPAPAA